MSDKITKAKAQLILTQPFFASILLGMPMIPDASVKTMGTDGEKIVYNPAFADNLSLPGTVFVLAHEVMHCVFNHMFRRGTRDHGRWNIAGDYIINDILVKDNVGVMPEGGLYDPQLVINGKGTTEGVYALIPESENGKGPGDPGGALDEVSDAPGDASEQARKEAEMQVKVIQAATNAKAAGKLSAGLQRLVKEVLAPRVDWKSVLRRFLSDRAKVDLSYAKPKRRFMADDLNLPSLTGERLGGIVVAVDCSGSVTEEQLAEFSAEIRAIIEDVAPAVTDVLYFDTKVLRRETYTPDDTIDLKHVGGGGTRFSPVFAEIERLDLNPVACVFLTDLDCSDFGPQPGYPVLWASIAPGTAPFGEIVLIK